MAAAPQPHSSARGSNNNHSLLQLINKTISVTTDDGRKLTGKLVVFDKHMNVVLCDVIETRMISKKSEEVAQRTLGLVLLRGEHVVNLTSTEKAASRAAASNSGKGTGIATKKSIPVKRDRPDGE